MKIKIQQINVLLLLFAMSSTLLLTGCLEEEPEPDDNEDEVTLEADFSFSPETPKIGEEVTLDATASFEVSNTSKTNNRSLNDFNPFSAKAKQIANSISTKTKLICNFSVNQQYS